MRYEASGVMVIHCDGCGAYLGDASRSGGVERHRDPFECIAFLRQEMEALKRNARLIHIP